LVEVNISPLHFLKFIKKKIFLNTQQSSSRKKEYMDFIQDIFKKFSPKENYDLTCPGCFHIGMKTAGGINQITKPEDWKCLCPKKNPEVCQCRYGWKSSYFN